MPQTKVNALGRTTSKEAIESSLWGEIMAEVSLYADIAGAMPSNLMPHFPENYLPVFSRHKDLTAAVG